MVLGLYDFFGEFIVNKFGGKRIWNSKDRRKLVWDSKIQVLLLGHTPHVRLRAALFQWLVLANQHTRLACAHTRLCGF